MERGPNKELFVYIHVNIILALTVGQNLYPGYAVLLASFKDYCCSMRGDFLSQASVLAMQFFSHSLVSSLDFVDLRQEFGANRRLVRILKHVGEEETRVSLLQYIPKLLFANLA
jgi:hypothetical protein